MISFFRRALSSWLVLGLLGLILIAFVITGIGTPDGFGGLPGGSGGSIVTVGGQSVSENEVRRRVQTQLEAARQQQPDLDMAAFVAGGGLERTIDQIVNGLALEQFAKNQGMVASKRLVDGQIASIPAFNGPTGKFDRTTYLAALAARRIPEGQLRDDFGREALTRMLLSPVAGATRFPTGMVDPYASLLLEARLGQIGVVPSLTFANLPAPSPQDLTNFYNRNLARYTLPERRVVRYAQFDRTRFEGKVTPTEAEVAALYKSNAAAYAAKETRGFTQIIVPTQAQANALLVQVKSGTAMADAAKSVSRSTLSVPPIDRAGFEKLTDPRVAAAAFAAPKGGFAPVAASGLGFHVVRVDSIASIAGKSLAEVRPTIVAGLTQRKMDEAANDLATKLDDEISDGSTFDEIAKKYALAVETTPPVTAAGLAPGQPDFRPSTELQAILRDAYQAEPDDAPTVMQLNQGRSFALFKLDNVVAAAPRPLAEIRDQVMGDARLDAASKAARKVADAIAANVNRGMPFAQAVATSGVKLPPLQPAGGKRLEIARGGERVPPPLALMFSMAEKRAKVLGAPNGQGWFIVYLDKIDRGNATAQPALIEATREQLSRVVSGEYADQFVAAIKTQAGVKRNEAAITTLKQALGGASAAR